MFDSLCQACLRARTAFIRRRDYPAPTGRSPLITSAAAYDRGHMAPAGDVFVFTGPAFSQPASTIGAGGVWVPSPTWKVVYSRAEVCAWAYWMTNTGGPAQPQTQWLCRGRAAVGVGIAQDTDALIKTICVATHWRDLQRIVFRGLA